MRAKGLSYAALAEHFGVSQTSVTRVCDPATNARLVAQTKKWTERHRRECLGGCGRRVWMTGKGRSGYCIKCLREKWERERKDVRDGELLCLKCGEWKPDEEFSTRTPSKKRTSRRGRTPWCRACNTEARRAHRRRRPDMQHTADIRAGVKKGRLKMQRYVVLVPEGEGHYREVGRVDAAGPVHAVETAAQVEGTFVAIAESRFVPMTVAPVKAFRVVKDES